MAATLVQPIARADLLLRDNAVNDLRRLEVMESDAEIVISGVVSSYYLKQMAQEAIRPALCGRRLRNQIRVSPAR